MNQFDIQYRKLIENVLNDGKWNKGKPVRPKWKDGSPAYNISLLNQKLHFDGTEVPILTTKQVYWKSAIKEMLWIWQYKSNDVNLLEKMGVKVWNEWKREDGTIGKAYGWQLAEKKRLFVFGGHRVWLDQVDVVIHSLKVNPYSNRIMTTLWDVEDLDDMSLEPCVWNTHWQVWDDKLHLTVNVRSNDIACGQPFNVFQYYCLFRMIAQVTNWPVGTMTFNIDNAHIYERHVEGLEMQIGRKPFKAPKLIINPSVKDFYDFQIGDFILEGYDHHEKIDFEIAE